MRLTIAALLLLNSSLLMAAEPYLPTGAVGYGSESTPSRYTHASTANNQTRLSVMPADDPVERTESSLGQFEIQVGTSAVRAEMLNNKYQDNMSVR